MPTENREWQGTTGGGKFGQRSLIFIFKYVDVRLIYPMVAMIIPFYMMCTKKSYQCAYRYFREKFYFSPFQSFCKTYKNYYTFGKIIVDRFAVFAGKGDTFKVDIIGQEYFDSLMNAPEGFIFTSAHVGNFEIAGYLLRQDKKMMNLVAYDGETSDIKENRSRSYAKNNCKIIEVKDDMSHLFAIKEALSKGEILGLSGDRTTFKNTKNYLYDFLGHQAAFPTGVFHLAVQFDVKVLAIFVMKMRGKRYQIYVRPIELTGACIDKKEKIEKMTELFIKELEDVLCQYPEQWFNYYNFWTA